MKKNLITRGATFVELLIYMAIFSMLLVSFSQIFGSVLNVQQESQVTSHVVMDGQYILQRLSFDIQRASAVTTPLALGTQTTNLSITINSVSSSYSLSNGNLIVSNANGTDTLNGFDTSISNLTFQRLGNQGGKDTIKISFTVTSKTQRGSNFETKNYQTTIGLR